MKKLFLIVVAVLLLAGNAHALSFLSLKDIVNDVEVTTYSDSGYIGYYGLVSDTWVSFTSGVSQPIIGSSISPELVLNSIDVTTAAAGELQLQYTVTNFEYTSGLSGLMTDINATWLSGTISYQVYIGIDNNEEIAGDYLLFDIDVDSTDNYYESALFESLADLDLEDGDLFSISIIASIIHDGAGTTSFDANVNPVPEPATMLLLGTGLVGLAGVSRKKFFGKK